MLEWKELDELSTAITVSNCSNSAIAFWNILDNSNYGTLEAAIICATEAFGANRLSQELTDQITDNGIEYLNQFQYGIFEEVCLNKDSGNSNTFYIYNVDSANWKI